MNESQLRWQCRRGMRELDELLLRYLTQRYASAAEREKAAFRQLLSLPDPDLIGYLLHRQEPATEDLAAIVDRILHVP